MRGGEGAGGAGRASRGGVVVVVERQGIAGGSWRLPMGLPSWDIPATVEDFLQVYSPTLLLRRKLDRVSDDASRTRRSGASEGPIPKESLCRKTPGLLQQRALEERARWEARWRESSHGRRFQGLGVKGLPWERASGADCDAVPLPPSIFSLEFRRPLEIRDIRTVSSRRDSRQEAHRSPRRHSGPCMWRALAWHMVELVWDT